jgi:hypothetical protein
VVTYGDLVSPWSLLRQSCKPRSPVGLRKYNGDQRMYADLQDFYGATGLASATSGVTGRVGHDDCRRRTSVNSLIYRRFWPRGPPLLRMVEPVVQSTFGPRAGHGILSSWTTLASGARDVGLSRIRPARLRLHSPSLASHPAGWRPSERLRRRLPRRRDRVRARAARRPLRPRAGCAGSPAGKGLGVQPIELLVVVERVVMEEEEALCLSEPSEGEHSPRRECPQPM